jgi:folate-binding protein YgfZ
MTFIAALPHRAVLAFTGPDRAAFLNGLVSNDVTKAAPDRAVWAALLTSQGKYLFDFFVFATEDALLLEVRAEDIPALTQKLSRYKLRAAVDIAPAAYTVYAAWDGAPPAAEIAAPDPRHPRAGYRLLSATPLPATASAADYAAHRIGLGLPDGPPDLEPEKTLLLEANFDTLNGVDFAKGCYMGQEITARTKYRGLVKRRLVPVILVSPLPPSTPILADGLEVGDIRSSAGTLALAMLRLDALDKTLTAGEGAVRPLKL